MLDHRNVTVSSGQYDGDDALWTRTMNEFGWRCLLGDTPDDEVSVYASPALARRPVRPAARLHRRRAPPRPSATRTSPTRPGSGPGRRPVAELHIWAGGFHGFDLIYPAAQVSQAARAARNDWLARLLRR